VSRLWDGRSSANEIAEARGDGDEPRGRQYGRTIPYSAETLAYADRLMAKARELGCVSCGGAVCPDCVDRACTALRGER
jgi:hypothetical protein